MSAQKLTAFEQTVIASLASRAGLAAALLDAWAEVPASSTQTVRSLIDYAQLGVTEERAAAEVLKTASRIGLLDEVSDGFRARESSHPRFGRLAFALNTIQHYAAVVHRDDTRVKVVLTKPPRPSVLERKLADLGWRTADLEATDHAFNGMVRSAQRRVVVLTPFFDIKGASWLRELFGFVTPGVERVLVLRSLEAPTRNDYPKGFDTIRPWLIENAVKIFNYSIPRMEGDGRETFHAKVVLCDRSCAYLGSSNMNAASLEHSMEMGVVLEGRAAADVAEVVDAVIAAATRRL